MGQDATILMGKSDRNDLLLSTGLLSVFSCDFARIKLVATAFSSIIVGLSFSTGAHAQGAPLTSYDAGYCSGEFHVPSGAEANITVPSDATQMYVKIWGAGGGADGAAKGGAGGYVDAVIPVAGNAQFTAIVGVRGGSNPSGGPFGFGGLPHSASSMGGGLSGIFTGSGVVLETEQSRAMLIAGGGGGGERTAGPNGGQYNGGMGGGPSLSGGNAGTMHGQDGVPVPFGSSGGSGGGYEGGIAHQRNPANPAITNTFAGGGGSNYIQSAYTGQNLFMADNTEPFAPNNTDVHYVYVNSNNLDGNPGATGEGYRGGGKKSGGGGLIVVQYDNCSTPISAVDDDFTSIAIPASGGTTPSVFADDDYNGATPTQSTVDVTLTNLGGLTGATVNADGTIDVPAGTPAGTYTLTYQICEAGATTSCDTATVMIEVAAPLPLDVLARPSACGAYNHAGWSVPGGPFINQNILFGSGDSDKDPYEYAGLTRDSSGKIVTSYGTPSHTDSAASGNPARFEIETHNNTTAPYLSEYHKTIYRLEWVPGETGSVSFNSGGGADNLTAWIEDTSGNVIANSTSDPASDDGWVYSLFNTTTLTFTYPADGIAYLYGGLFDPSGNYGGTSISGFECPTPSLNITKIADDDTDRKLGETITYTYTAINDGNIDIADVTVTDVHSGSGALSAISIDALSNSSGNSSDDGADNDIDVLAPNDSVTFEATYVVTEADVVAGNDITNTATVVGVPAAGALGGPITVDEAVTVAPLDVDLSITKTNTPGTNGEIDQAADTLTSGTSTTYVLEVTNNGPDAVLGAVVTDVVGAGLTCAAADPVTITGDGIPMGSFTIGDLTGTGIALETLEDGEIAMLTYTCEVN